ncbi:MAG: GTPase Era [Treponema sp.]|nr:GTPase Era [Treponema sp.]
MNDISSKINLSDLSQENSSQEKKVAVVALIGRPSSGKSTFVNTACQENVSIVSSIPQTTRDAIRGIVNTSLGQLVFIDTPGYHVSEKKLNLKLKALTEEQLSDADAILYIIDSTRVQGEEEELITELLKTFQERTIVAINKSDLPDAKTQNAKDFVNKNLPQIAENKIFQISAKEDKNIDNVLRSLYEIAPLGPLLYPEEYYTDQEVDFRIAEIIRGEAINRLKDEIPHCLYVSIADIEMKKNGKLLWVRAFLCVERESQKGIVIGKNASMIKEIRLASLKKFDEIFDYKIDLDLQVKVDKNWRQKDNVLKKLIK